MNVFNHRVLSVKDRERLRREIDEKRREMKGEIVVPRHPNGKEEGLSERRMGRYAEFLDKNIQSDKGLLQKQVSRLERVLSNGMPDSLTKAKRIALEKQIAKDKEFLQKNMVPKDLLYVKYKDPNFERSKVACSLEGRKEVQMIADRYKNSMRQIDPENPDASNLERIRPEHG